MTEHDDSLSRRYRELAREEPPAALDAAIVSAARRAANARPRRNWGATVSIAAVLVLGFGISLRMQLEQPSLETSAPASERFAPPPAAAPAAPATLAPPEKQAPRMDAARALEKSVRAPAPTPEPAPKSAPPPKPAPATATPPAPALETQPAARTDAASDPAARAKVKREEAARPFADSMQQSAPPPPTGEALGRVAQEPAQSKDAGTPSANVASPAKAAAPATPSARAVTSTGAVSAPPVPAAAAPAPFQSPALRPRVQASPQQELATEERKQSGASVGIRGLSPSTLAEPDTALEAIARLREQGRDAEADKALEEFRRTHPDFRIPEAMWERVRRR